MLRSLDTNVVPQRDISHLVVFKGPAVEELDIVAVGLGLALRWSWCHVCLAIPVITETKSGELRLSL